MPDISMCTGENCPRKETCWRFTAPPTPIMQSYFQTPPISHDATCDWYWEDDRVHLPVKP